MPSQTHPGDTRRTGAPDTSASARRWGWAILLLTSSISLAFNIGHALAHPHPTVPVALAILYGVAPVLVALMVSHLIAIQGGRWFKRLVTAMVFVAAMALSVRAIYEVLRPVAGWWGLVFAFMLDLASLLALNEVLASGAATGDGNTDRHTPPATPVGDDSGDRHLPTTSGSTS
jgi:hypothetical protein